MTEKELGIQVRCRGGPLSSGRGTQASSTLLEERTETDYLAHVIFSNVIDSLSTHSPAHYW